MALKPNRTCLKQQISTWSKIWASCSLMAKTSRVAGRKAWPIWRVKYKGRLSTTNQLRCKRRNRTCLGMANYCKSIKPNINNLHTKLQIKVSKVQRIRWTWNRWWSKYSNYLMHFRRRHREKRALQGSSIPTSPNNHQSNLTHKTSFKKVKSPKYSTRGTYRTTIECKHLWTKSAYL